MWGSPFRGANSNGGAPHVNESPPSGRPGRPEPTIVAGVRDDLRAIEEELFDRATKGDRSVSLDAIGTALGARQVSAQEIDALVGALEARGIRVTGPEGQRGEANLAKVIAATRALKGELGRAPSRNEVAARAGISEDAVAQALALVRTMQK